MSEWLWGGGRVAGEWTGGGWKQTGKSLNRQTEGKLKHNSKNKAIHNSPCAVPKRRGP